jgi:hypothetical protein
VRSQTAVAAEAGAAAACSAARFAGDHSDLFRIEAGAAQVGIRCRRIAGSDADGLWRKSLAVGCSSTGFIIKYELIYASLLIGDGVFRELVRHTVTNV